MAECCISSRRYADDTEPFLECHVRMCLSSRVVFYWGNNRIDSHSGISLVLKWNHSTMLLLHFAMLNCFPEYSSSNPKIEIPTNRLSLQMSLISIEIPHYESLHNCSKMTKLKSNSKCRSNYSVCLCVSRKSSLCHNQFRFWMASQFSSIIMNKLYRQLKR